MPRVKIDYVVSFSSEDPENQANNLLAWDVTKKMWLCTMGETSCSVVLQLARTVKVESITIGTYHTSLLEVLVGLSEKPDAPFEVLVPRCAVLSPREARAGPAPRVRSFTRDGLVASVGERRWDRLRIVCSQPYDKHCKYGLSFVHIFEPETPRSLVPAVPQRVLRLDALSDDEDFRPGELFAKHSQELQEKTSTDAQIRHATSQALKNISDSSTKLMKTPISKTNSKDHYRKNSGCSNREKNSLLYTDDDEQPHVKIDHIVQRHKDQKQKEESPKISTDNNCSKDSNKKKQNKETTTTDTKKTAPKDKTPLKKDIPVTAVANGSNKKRKRTVDDEAAPDPGRAASILSGVVFSLSGYVNPERGALRAAAVRMGAQYRADWGPDCTHLICAFPNTPRLRALRSSGAGRGAPVPAVTGAWLTACERAGRRLPWRAFATEPHLRDTAAVEEDEPATPNDAGDTDDEIEKVLRQTKKKRTAAPTPRKDSKQRLPQSPRSPPPSRDSSRLERADTSNDSDVTFVRDERVVGDVTVDSTDDDTDVYDADTDHEPSDHPAEEIDDEKSLPLSLDGVCVSVCGLGERARGVVSRYVTAYGGLALDSGGVSPASLTSLWRQRDD